MRITYLLEDARGLWGGVKTVLEEAGLLAARGHQVTVVARSEPPDWMEPAADFRRVPDLSPGGIPPSDLVVGTYWSTVPYAVLSGRGVPVHYCQGFEGENPETASRREHIDAVYRFPETFKITISPHLTRLLRARYGVAAREVTYMVDHRVFHPGPERPPGSPLRVGLVGPYQIAWKDIPTGIRACELAWRAGLDLKLIRATGTEPHPAERELAVPFEGCVRVPPARMGAFYRSLDLFLGTSWGPEEGFFMPAVEAMACGVACILTDIPCFRGYGPGNYALFVPPRDPAAMAEAMVVAAGQPRVTARLRREGLDLAARYRPERHIQELEAAFLSILAEARGPLPAAAAQAPARA